MKNYLKSFMHMKAFTQLMKVGVIGVFNTIVDFAFANYFRFGLEWSNFWSVTWAFTIATGVSYVLNRHWTFEIKHGRGLVRESVLFYAVNVVAWAVSVSIVLLADSWFGPLDRISFNVAKLSSVVIVLLPKFASYRDLVFKASRLAPGAEVPQEDADRVSAHLPQDPGS